MRNVSRAAAAILIGLLATLNTPPITGQAYAVGPNSPSSPTNLQATVSGTTIDLTWDAPTSGAAVTGYELDWALFDPSNPPDWDPDAQANRPNWQWVFPDANATSAQITGLAPGTYNIMINANASGCSTGFECASLSTYIANYIEIFQSPSGPNPPINTPTAPEVPESFGAVANGMGIDLHWDAPTNGNLPAVDHYIFSWRLTTNSVWSVDDLLAPATSVSILHLIAGTYRVKVSAQAAGCNFVSDCNSGDTAEIEVVVELPPPQLDEAAAIPQNTSIDVNGDNVLISWDAGTWSAAVESYVVHAHPNVYVVPDHEGFFAPVDYPIELAGNQTSFFFEHLRPGSWIFSVQAKYVDGFTSDWVESVPTSIDVQFASVIGNFPRIYSSARNEFRATVTEIPESYSVVFRSGSQILKVQSLVGNNDIGPEPITINWAEISSCSITNPGIEVDVVYLTSEEVDRISGGCADGDATISNISDFSGRVVGFTQFEFKTTAIPAIAATFVDRDASNNELRSREIAAYDGDHLAWPQEPQVNTRNPQNGAKFLGWEDSYGRRLDLAIAPVANGIYYQVWEPYPDVTIPLRIDFGGNELTFADLTNDTNYLLWDDAEGVLDVNVTVLPGVLVNLSLQPVVLDLVDMNMDSNYWLESPNSSHEFLLSDFPECEGDVNQVGCQRIYRLQIRTEFENPDTTVSITYFFFYLIRTEASVSPVVTYHIPNSANVADTYEQNFDHSDWYTLIPAGQDETDSRIFGGWCLFPENNDSNSCLSSETKIPVIEDLDFYPLWLENSAPTSITIGDRTFTSQDWIVDHDQRLLLLTVESNDLNLLRGPIEFEGSVGIDYDEPDVSVGYVHANEVEPVYGEFTFSPGCNLPTHCSEIYWIASTVWINGNPGPGYGVLLIVTNYPNAEFPVSYNLGNGDLISDDVLRVGWHQLPQGQWSRLGYTHGDTTEWTTDLGSNTVSDVYWTNYFPVIREESVSLAWSAIEPNVQPQEQPNSPPETPAPTPAPQMSTPNGNGSVTDSLPEVIVTKPLQQPKVLLVVSTSRIGIGAKVRIESSGGVAGGAKTFHTRTPRVCSVDSSGMVTALAAGDCQVSLEVQALSGNYAPASSDNLVIKVLGKGLINVSTVKIVGGKTQIGLSLLSKYAGKTATLKIIGGKPLVIGSVKLGKDGAGKLTTTRKFRIGSKVTIFIANKAVHSFVLGG